MSVLESCMRDDLNEHAQRRIAVLDPVRLIIDNYPEGQSEDCLAPNHPQQPELGKRAVPLSRELWIEREDFSETPPKGYFRLYPPRLDASGITQPGNKVRLRYGYVVECTGCDKDGNGNVTAVHCTYLPQTKSGTPGADSIKVKGNIHWVSAQHACQAEVRLYDRLFVVAHPGRERDYLQDINPASKKVITAQLEPSLKEATPEDHFQFERHGYFVADLKDSKAGKPVFNRTVTLKDSWTRSDG
jgi:glutaminyl-tRNA synthetase